jgi:hypothetical protein
MGIKMSILFCDTGNKVAGTHQILIQWNKRVNVGIHVNASILVKNAQSPKIRLDRAIRYEFENGLVKF